MKKRGKGKKGGKTVRDARSPTDGIDQAVPKRKGATVLSIEGKEGKGESVVLPRSREKGSFSPISKGGKKKNFPRLLISWHAV